MPAEPITIREATAADEAFLWTMLAASVHAGPPWSVEQARSTPGVAHHLTGWPRPGDLGVVATSAADRAAAAGIARVGLSVNPTNLVAHRLYSSFGFEPADVEPDPGGSLTLVVTLR